MKIGNLFSRVKSVNQKISLYIEDCTIFTYFYCWFDIILCRIFFGINIGQYLGWRVYEKSLWEKHRCLSDRKYKIIVKKVCKNLHDTHMLFTAKKTFNTYFKNYIGREWLDINKITFTEFEKFTQKHKNVILKRDWLCEGMGVSLFSYENTQQAQKAFKEYSQYDSLVEECVIQHPEMAGFSKSVNTLRMATLIINDEAHLISCGMRIGRGNSIVDNTNAGGFACDVDTEHGIIATFAKNNDSGKKYYFHPDNSKQILGFQIPFWEETVALVKKAALDYKDAGWIGWDVAITPQGPVLIEGNSTPFGVFQVNSSGKWLEVKKLLAKIK